MNVVQAMNVISYEDYMDAKSILDGIGSKYSISGSINCERMNEVNPHTKWARKIMILSDIVALAKAGYSPKQVKELLEMVETSPKVKEADLKDVVDKKEKEPEVKKPEVETKVDTEDPIAQLVNILKEE